MMTADRDLVVKCWREIENACDGGVVLTCLFQNNPDTRNQFPESADIPHEVVPQCVRVTAYSKKVLKELGKLVESKKGREALIKLLGETPKNAGNNLRLIVDMMLKVMEKQIQEPVLRAFERVMEDIIADINK
ncbi:myoglobin-like isoform X3 [Labeo rohita]|uniref:myoglobin-like isoform X3 n=1 Tax=Labeo rohita TaxID=84645 RepID=UPI0021E2C29B|nr:myoglobin-like isoform X3 [Labeo rohita]